MILGAVTDDREAVIRVVVRGPGGREQQAEAVVDTGFDGWGESVFDIYDGTVVWDGTPRRIAVDEASTASLIGMALLDGYELNVQVRSGGRVSIRALP
jgi:predicted aspartyl protease